MKTKKAFQPNKVYQIVTDKIIAQIKDGNTPWSRPWKPADAPKNISGRRYSGINTFLLDMEREEKEYESNLWMTYQQATVEFGGDVKGEHTTMVIYASTFDKKPNDAGKVEKGFSMKYSTRLKPLKMWSRECPTVQLSSMAEIEPITHPLWTGCSSLHATVSNPPHTITRQRFMS